MLDRVTQPAIEPASPSTGHAVDSPVRPGVTLLHVSRPGIAALHETVESSVDERTAHVEDPPDIGVDGEFFGQRKAVPRSFGEKAENRVFGQREISHRLGRAFVTSTVVTVRLLTVLAIGPLVAACAADTGRGELVVSAAASLTDAFGAIEVVFEDANPDIDVILNFGGSSTLREQILDGASIDVFASANPTNIEQVAASGRTAADPLSFTSNRLQIAVPAGNPAGIRGLDDLGDERLLIGLCAAGVPCGDFARDALGKAGVTPSLDTSEPDVRSLITKIEEGELDAGITYASDVASSSAIEGIPIPEEFNVIADYQIVVVSDAANPDLAAAFIDFVRSAEGQEIMTDFGFGPP